MHIIATNLCVWLRVITVEAAREIHTFMPHTIENLGLSEAIGYIPDEPEEPGVPMQHQTDHVPVPTIDVRRPMHVDLTHHNTSFAHHRRSAVEDHGRPVGVLDICTEVYLAPSCDEAIAEAFAVDDGKLCGKERFRLI